MTESTRSQEQTFASLLPQGFGESDRRTQSERSGRHLFAWLMLSCQTFERGDDTR